MPTVGVQVCMVDVVKTSLYLYTVSIFYVTCFRISSFGGMKVDQVETAVHED